MAHRDSSGDRDVTGERVERLDVTQATIDRSAVRWLDTEDAEVDRTAIQHLRATTADVTQSAIASASFERGTIRQSTAGVIVGRSVACDEIRTGILISPVVRGDVHAWIDLRSAVAIGFGMALGRLMIAAVRDGVRRAFS